MREGSSENDRVYLMYGYLFLLILSFVVSGLIRTLLPFSNHKTEVDAPNHSSDIACQDTIFHRYQCEAEDADQRPQLLSCDNHGPELLHYVPSNDLPALTAEECDTSDEYDSIGCSANRLVEREFDRGVLLV